jgi:hypothetical protein
MKIVVSRGSAELLRVDHGPAMGACADLHALLVKRRYGEAQFIAFKLQ